MILKIKKKVINHCNKSKNSFFFIFIKTEKILKYKILCTHNVFYFYFIIFQFNYIPFSFHYYNQFLTNLINIFNYSII